MTRFPLPRCSIAATLLATCLFTHAVSAQESSPPAAVETVTKTYEFGDGPMKQKLALTIPKTWEEQPVSNNLRIAQFKIPAAAGAEPAELAVFPPFGGTIQQNIDRQVAVFESEGRTLASKKGTAVQGDFVIAELGGTYKRPVGPPVLQRTESVPNQRMLYVVLTLKSGGNCFLKVTGPDKLVTDVRGLVIKSIGGDPEKLEEYAAE